PRFGRGGGRPVAQRGLRARDRSRPGRAAGEARTRGDLPRAPRAPLVPLREGREGCRARQDDSVVRRKSPAVRAGREPPARTVGLAGVVGSVEPHEPDPHRWQALALVCGAFFMTILDVSIVNVALPSIKNSLHVSDNTLQWVLIAYTITFGGFLLL